MPAYQDLFIKIKNVFFGLTSSLNQDESPKEKILYLLQDIISQHLADHNLHGSDLQIESYFLTQHGVLVFFHLSINGQISVYTQLLDKTQPDHLLWKKPRFIINIGQENDGWKFDSLALVEGSYLADWFSPTLGRREITYPKYFFKNEIELKHQPMVLYKPKDNPVLKPNSTNSWEAFCTFNPAAVYAADQVHLLYRAQGHDYVSQIGYAASSDGVSLDKRLSQPVYRPTQKFEGATMPLSSVSGQYVSGGGCGGCEDPRATIIDDRLYMTYVAYDGWNPPRIALTSIALNDFLNHDFFWKKPVLISPPNVVDKSAVIFPEKINGQYVIMHRVFPNILIDYVDSLNFDGRTYLHGQHQIAPRSREWWDSRKIGAGAPPLKTKEGWLLIYQAVDDKDASQYKVGAMLLDLDDPTHVLRRSQHPILEAKETYENYGFKAGVVYPCGAVIKDQTLFVYYGGADSYVCVATAPLDQFLSNLKKTGSTQLSPAMLGIK